MKRGLLTCLVLLVAVWGADTAAATTRLTKLGTSPFIIPPLENEEQLREMIRDRQADLAKGFEKAGRPDLLELINRQIDGLAVESVQVRPGEKMMWMLFKKNKRVRVIEDVVWAGKAPFDAFRFFVEDSGRRYEFLVPLACGNIGLRQVVPLPPPAPKPPEPPKIAITPPPPEPSPPPPPPNQPPTCNCSVDPQQVYAGQEVTVDAGGSTDTDGRVVSAVVTLTGPDGSVVSENTLTQAPFSLPVTLPVPGVYTVTVQVTDDDGAVSPPDQCRRQVTAMRRGAPLADLGILHLPDPATYLMMRVGYEYRFNETFSMVGLLGFNPVIDGDDDTNAISADVTANARSGRLFVGVGVGGFLSSENDRFDLVANVGGRLYGDPEAFNVSLFVEGRCAFDEFDDASNLGRIGTGLRFQF